MNYYNEIDPYAAQWLRNLIQAKLIPAGRVDVRSIKEVQAVDLVGYTQCHFFAGIGGWPLALAMAGWAADEPVWTGSCPCQPFSVAGRHKGEADERHLWPDFRRLILERRPPVVFGEQVAGKAGEIWFAGVRADLEAGSYEAGCSDLPAACLNAPHIRQRLYWVADTERDSRGPGRPSDESSEGAGAAPAGAPVESGRRGDLGGVGNAFKPRLEGYPRNGSDRHEPGRLLAVASGPATAAGGACGMGDAEGDHERRGSNGAHREGQPTGRPGEWDAYVLVPCADGKVRRIGPGVAPMAHGVPARVGKLRAYGNAICPPLAREFIEAYREVRG